MAASRVAQPPPGIFTAGFARHLQVAAGSITLPRVADAIAISEENALRIPAFESQANRHCPRHVVHRCGRPVNPCSTSPRRAMAALGKRPRAGSCTSGHRARRYRGSHDRQHEIGGVQGLVSAEIRQKLRLHRTPTLVESKISLLQIRITLNSS